MIHHALRSDEVADLQDLEASIRRLNDVRVTFETGRVCFVESCHNRDAVCICIGTEGTSDLQLCREHAMVLFDGLTEALRG